MNENPIGAVVVGTGFGLFAHVHALRMAGFEVRADDCRHICAGWVDRARAGANTAWRTG